MRTYLLQIYPESPAQAEMLTSAAMRAGFTGGLVVDFPHSTRAKKCAFGHAHGCPRCLRTCWVPAPECHFMCRYFLVLMVGQSPSGVPQPKGLDGEDSEEAGISVIGRRSGHHAAKRRKHGAVAGSTMSARHPEQKGRAWIEKKKVPIQPQSPLLLAPSASLVWSTDLAVPIRLCTVQENMRRKGYDNVPADSKYTGRKRKTRF